jgi:sirohydrochlorin ferrochelatase
MPEPERPVLVAVAHGSKDPRAAATVDALMSLVRARTAAAGLADVEVRTAYLGHAAPSLPQVLSAVARPGRPVTVLPLLLTPAYHSKVDIPRLLARSRFGGSIAYGDTLGPDALLLRALDRRLGEAGVCAAARAEVTVVLAAAGSSDPEADLAISRLAAQWQARSGWRAVVPAYASAAAPRPAEAVAAARASGAHQVVVATYLLAPGYFADRIREESIAAGAGPVCAALGAAPELAELILDRYRAARLSRERAA